METSIGEKKLDAIMKLLNSQKSNMSDGEYQELKESVEGILGVPNIGYWHIADQIQILQRSLKSINQWAK